MSLNQIFDVAGSALVAHSTRLNTTASNLANVSTAASSAGGVYKPRYAVFESIHLEHQEAGTGFNGINTSHHEHGGHQGVKVAGIVESKVEAEKRHQPGHPLADADGYVYYPQIDVSEQMADMLAASRNYQFNIESLNTARQLVMRTLNLGQ
jgi:flagellar basal-body rod protein FlgC